MGRKHGKNVTIAYNGHVYKCNQNKRIEDKLVQELERKAHDGIGSSKMRARKAAQNAAEAAGADKKTRSHAQSESIHSVSTLQTYVQQVHGFGSWLDQRGLTWVCWSDAKALARDYIQSDCWNSAWTQNAARSALAKAFGIPTSEFGPAMRRHAGEIRRGRGSASPATLACQAALEKNHPDYCEIARSCGMRSNKEFAKITASCFEEKTDGLHFTVQGKGGRIRDSLVIGDGADLIRERIHNDKSNGSAPLFHVFSHSNLHAMRADYAVRAYKYAMDHGFSSGEYYTCRTTGRTYDKGALAWVSQQLGHGNDRHYTVCSNYLSYGGE